MMRCLFASTSFIAADEYRSLADMDLYADGFSFLVVEQLDRHATWSP